MRTRALIIAALAAGCVAWLDPYAKAREGNRLLAAGKYDEAAAKYNEALVDEPDSPQLHFNQGVAAYKQAKYDDALKAFQQVTTHDEDPVRTARVMFNLGNTKAKLAEAAEASDAKTALSSYAESLALYRRAMGAAPNDLDIKFNHELVEKKLADLKQKLEEQKKQPQDQQQQPNDQPQQDQQNQDQQKQDQQNQGDQNDQQKQNEQAEQPQKQPDQQQAQQPDEKNQQPQANGEAEAGEKKDGEMSKQEAAAVLDSQRDQEVQPGDVVKKLQGAAIAEPAQDW